MIAPPKYTDQEMEAARKTAIQIFCAERIKEPLEHYLSAFDSYRADLERLLTTTANLTEIQKTALEIISDPSLLGAFRYTAGPPISEDDLTVLANIGSLNSKRLASSPEELRRVIDVIRLTLDRRRFQWIFEARPPTESERSTAIIASAALMAASRVQTSRRNLSKETQELRVVDHLVELGFTQVKRRTIETLANGPSPGEFCRESLLGNRKADIIVRLFDGRLLPIECKVSNSSVNSVKRLNNDAAVKAETWKRDFGLRQVVPAALLSGVYNLANLMDAQDRGLAIFWAHNLTFLTNWIATTK